MNKRLVVMISGKKEIISITNTLETSYVLGYDVENIDIPKKISLRPDRDKFIEAYNRFHELVLEKVIQHKDITSCSVRALIKIIDLIDKDERKLRENGDDVFFSFSKN